MIKKTPIQIDWFLNGLIFGIISTILSILFGFLLFGSAHKAHASNNGYAFATSTNHNDINTFYTTTHIPLGLATGKTTSLKIPFTGTQPAVRVRLFAGDTNLHSTNNVTLSPNFDEFTQIAPWVIGTDAPAGTLYTLVVMTNGTDCTDQTTVAGCKGDPDVIGWAEITDGAYDMPPLNTSAEIITPLENFTINSLDSFNIHYSNATSGDSYFMLYGATTTSWTYVESGLLGVFNTASTSLNIPLSNTLGNGTWYAQFKIIRNNAYVASTTIRTITISTSTPIAPLCFGYGCTSSSTSIGSTSTPPIDRGFLSPLRGTFPFAYFFDFKDILASSTATSTASFPTVQIWFGPFIGTSTVFSSGTITYFIGSTNIALFRTLMSYSIWIGFAYGIYWITKNKPTKK